MQIDMSIFEIVMLLCFGIAWPFSIYKSFTSRTNKGKSFLFLFVVFFGYVSGTIHKLLYNFDPVTFMYSFNGLMVLTDMILYFRNMYIERLQGKIIPRN